MPWRPWVRGQDQVYIPPRMSDRQMQALEQFVTYSVDASDLATRVIIWTLRQTDNLTRRVALSVPDDYCDPDEAAHVKRVIQDMRHMNGSDVLSYFMAGMGTEFRLDVGVGCFVPWKSNRGFFDTKGKGRTIWVSYILYDNDVAILDLPPIEVMKQIELPSRM